MEYKPAVIYSSRFLSSSEKIKIMMQATAGISKRLSVCTPKKKNSISIRPAQRYSYNIPLLNLPI
jgi:hypothetical protein